jgi:hypothetical protein
MPNTNEWHLLKRQFDALMHAAKTGDESVEDILDIQFRHRFAELINQIVQRNSASRYNWPRQSALGPKRTYNSH